MIQLFSPRFNEKQALENIEECLRSGWTGYGKKSKKFETVWKEYIGFEHALFVNNATAGLDLVFSCMKHLYGWDDNDEVITTPLTFVSTNHAILKAGLLPVFADVNDTLCIDPRSAKQMITNKTRALIYVGLGGNAGDWDQIVKLCKEFQLKLIVDAAHMAGTKWNNVIFGKEADVYISSFQSTKVLQTADSGMVCCHDENLMHDISLMAWCGIDKTSAPFKKEADQYWYYDVVCEGYSYLGNDIMAALALAQFETLENDIAMRHGIADKYREEFSDNPNIRMVRVPDQCYSAQWLFQIIVSDRRDAGMKFLFQKEIYTGLHYLDNTLYRPYNYARGTCRNAAYYSEHIISLPMHLKLSTTDIDYIVKQVNEFWR